MRRFGLFPLLATVAIVGCNSPDADLEPAFVPKTHVFEGEADPKFAGKWVSADGVSTLNLEKGGKLKIQTLTPSPSGKSETSVDGDWLVSKDSLLLQYGDAAKGKTVLKYKAELAGGTMILQQEGGRVKTTYKRK